MSGGGGGSGGGGNSSRGGFASKSGYATGGVGGERGAHDVGSNRGGGEGGLNSRGMTTRDMHGLMDARYHGDMAAINRAVPASYKDVMGIGGLMGYAGRRAAAGIGRAYGRGGFFGPGGVIDTDRPVGWNPPGYTPTDPSGEGSSNPHPRQGGNFMGALQYGYGGNTPFNRMALGQRPMSGYGMFGTSPFEQARRQLGFSENIYSPAVTSGTTPPDPMAVGNRQLLYDTMTANLNNQYNQIDRSSPFGRTYYEGEIGSPDRRQVTDVDPRLTQSFYNNLQNPAAQATSRDAAAQGRTSVGGTALGTAQGRTAAALA